MPVVFYCSPAYLCGECVEKVLKSMDKVPWDCIDAAVIDEALGDVTKCAADDHTDRKV
jgi:hypothetical protein